MVIYKMMFELHNTNLTAWLTICEENLGSVEIRV